MTATQKISAAVLAKIASGMDAKSAIDAVLGQGTYEKVAGEVYDELRAGK